MAQDYYQLLGVKRTATEAEISKAYSRQTRLCRSRLNAPDLKLRQEAERMLVDLETARKVLLNTKQYDSDRSNGVNKKKRYKQKRSKKFLLVAQIQLAFGIFYRGLSKAVIYILKISSNIIWKILKAVAIAIGFILLLCLFFTGLSGSIGFVISIYENQLARAFILLMYTYLSMSIVTYYKYWEDKRKAKRGVWRTSEAELHSFELLGGWFGGFCAQVLLRHKSSKESYQLVYWLIVVFHASLFLFFLPIISSFAIPQKYILMINGFLLLISLHGIRTKGVLS